MIKNFISNTRGGEHGVYKVDMTGTFRKESREFEGAAFEVY